MAFLARATRSMDGSVLIDLSDSTANRVFVVLFSVLLCVFGSAAAKPLQLCQLSVLNTVQFVLGPFIVGPLERLLACLLVRDE